MYYKLKVPPTNQQGSYEAIASSSFGESVYQNVLQQYNSARDHDGQRPLKQLPKGYILTAIINQIELKPLTK